MEVIRIRLDTNGVDTIEIVLYIIRENRIIMFRSRKSFRVRFRETHNGGDCSGNSRELGVDPSLSLRREFQSDARPYIGENALVAVIFKDNLGFLLDVFLKRFLIIAWENASP